MLTAVDEGIGNITLALKEYGLWENTILVLSTDNGGPTEVCSVQGSSNYPRRGGKCTVWEGGTSGDAILSGPYLSQKLQIPVPGTYDGIFHAVDWLPTLSDIAMSRDGHGDGEEDDIVSSNDTLLPPLLDGVSQLQGLRTGQPARTEVFVGYGFDQHKWYGPAIRVHQWKLIEGTTGGPDARNPKVPAVSYDFTTTTASNQMHPPFFNSHHQQQSQYFEENRNGKTSRDSKSNNVHEREEENEGTI